MGNSFYRYCHGCGKHFQDESLYNGHRKGCGRKAKVPGAVTIEKKADEEARMNAAIVPGSGADGFDEKLAASEELLKMKRQLAAVGIECATSTPQEAKELFEKAVKEGKFSPPEPQNSDPKPVNANELRDIKRKLTAAGIECANATPEEALKLFEQAIQDGKVKANDAK